MDEPGGHRARQRGLRPGRAGGDRTDGCSRRVRGGRGGQAGKDAPPGGDALAGEHAEPERERGRAGVQGSMTQLLVAGVQPAAGNMSLAGIRAYPRFSSRVARRRSQGQGRAVLQPAVAGGWVSGFWGAPGAGPVPAPRTGGARAPRIPRR